MTPEEARAEAEKIMNFGWPRGGWKRQAWLLDVRDAIAASLLAGYQRGEEAMRERAANVHRIGTLMSNVLFNLAQGAAIDHAMAKRLQTEWDEAVRALSTETST